MSAITTCCRLSSTYQCCSQVQTSLPNRSCFHCSRKCNAQRTHPWADKTCCTRSRSSARHSWPESGTHIAPQVRYESASASAGWGWSCRNERLSLLTSHLHLKCKILTPSTQTAKIESSVQILKPGREKRKAASYIRYKFSGCNVLVHTVGNHKCPKKFGCNLQKISEIADYM